MVRRTFPPASALVAALLSALAPLAANPRRAQAVPLGLEGGGPEGKDGPQLRPLRPSAMALTHRNPWQACVSDDLGHAVWRLTQEGRIVPLAGRPGEPGWADGPAAQARFRGPTFLAVLDQDTHPPVPRSRWGIYVADTDNHVIRLIQGERVTTFAGIPGKAGFGDAPTAAGALFSRPRGLAFDPEGNLYVADSGNRSIRRIAAAKPHAVTTVAGPGMAGPGAPVTDLKGLIWTPPSQMAVVDGNCVRAVDPGSGRSIILAGWPEREGFQDCAGQPPQPGQGVLCRPWDLMLTDAGILVGDEGNHAVRLLRSMVSRDPEPKGGGFSVQLSTVAGDPSLPWTHPGLLRPGGALPPGPLIKHMAGLAAPRSLLDLGHPMPDPRILVADGQGFTILDGLAPPREPGEVYRIGFPQYLEPGKTFRCQCRLLKPPPHDAPRPEIHYGIEFRDLDNPRLLSCQEGTLDPGTYLRPDFRVDAPGRYQIRLTVLNTDGSLLGITTRDFQVPTSRGLELNGPPATAAPAPAAPLVVDPELIWEFLTPQERESVVRLMAQGAIVRPGAAGQDLPLPPLPPLPAPGTSPAAPDRPPTPASRQAGNAPAAPPFPHAPPPSLDTPPLAKPFMARTSAAPPPRSRPARRSKPLPAKAPQAPAPPLPAPEGPGPAAPAQAAPPFILPERGFLHIQRRHIDMGPAGDPDASAFMVPYTTPEALLDLLRESRVTNPLAALILRTGNGRCSFRFQAGSLVGTLPSGLLTHHFQVVAERGGPSSPWEIVTAYPVAGPKP